MEPPYDEIEGVLSTTSGFMGGSVENPTYQQVTAGGTGHLEAVQVVFDPARVSYGQLLQVFWVNIDPLDDGGQFCDRGSIYRSAIFARGEEQGPRRRNRSWRSGRRGGSMPPSSPASWTPRRSTRPRSTTRDYYRKNPVRYRVYRTACGRDRRLRELWGADAG
jgi:peptide-methionine (S)-S-oxide reductase